MAATKAPNIIMLNVKYTLQDSYFLGQQKVIEFNQN